MFSSITAFFIAIVMAFLGLFGIGSPESSQTWDAPEVFWSVLDNLCDAGPPVLYFAVADINNDGTQELLLFDSSRSLHSLYTQSGTLAVPLIQWATSRVTDIIAADGTIFTRGAHSGFSATYSTSRLSPGATQLTELTSYTTDFINGQDVFRVGNGPWQPITPEKRAFLAQFMNIPNPMQFNFISVAQ